MKKSLLSAVALITLLGVAATPSFAEDKISADPLIEDLTIANSNTQPEFAGIVLPSEKFRQEQALFFVRLTPKSLDPFYGNLDAFYGNLDAFYGNLDAFYGNLDAFYGNLDAFWGNLDAFWGNLDAFEGDANASWGNLDAFYGNLDAFYGNLDAFYGNLDAFWGNLDAFYGNLDAFNGDLGSYWGNLDAFYGNLDAFYGNLDAFYGNLDAFWGNLDAFYGNLDAFWGNLDAFEGSEADYAQVAADLQTFIAMSKEAWEPIIVGLTGLSFEEAFANILLEKYGIDLDNPESLASLTAADRAKFFLDWHDNLMMFSGRDQVDVWMGQINWSPAITQQQGSGSDTIIGLLDFAVAGDADILNNLTVLDGASSVAGGHGAAVASLMVSDHDGFGVMGIAPNASVVAYNPFDETNTAGWEDITDGIIALSNAEASLINMSLGVSGWTLHQDWKDVFTNPDVIAATQNTVFIKAAGNDGITQTQDIDWDFSNDPNLIIVGAIGWDGEIADWSNTPGTACLLDNGVCEDGNRLMDRFIVAPGEMVLVSDDNGWVTRMSGTSFAAPLVSGAIALLHDRWPWLAQHPDETVDIILQSAQDLGAPGVDEVYGWGLLDVEASQSPLDFGNMTYFTGRLKKGTTVKLKNTSMANVQESGPSWGSHDVYYYAFEYLGDTFRDFAIPFSDALVGQSLNVNGEDQMFQQYIYDRFIDWQAGNSFTDSQTYIAPLPFGQDWNLAMTATPYAPGHEVRDGDLPFTTGFEMREASGKAKLKLGVGQGALTIASQNGFRLASDYDFETGGVNPLLGLASGGAYASAEVALSEKTSLNVGFTQTGKALEYQNPITGEYMQIVDGLENYEAAAAVASVRYQVNPRVSVNVGYTMLEEGTGLLGVQGLEPIDLKGGAVTDATSFGTDIAFPLGFEVSGTATIGKTRTAEFDNGNLRLEQGAVSSSWQLALGKTALLGKHDKLRMSLAQPFHVESGTLSFDSVQVIDRQTGEIGVVTQTFGMDGGERPYLVEGIYAAPMFEGAGQVSAFARAEFNREPTVLKPESSEVIFGGRLAIKF